MDPVHFSGKEVLEMAVRIEENGMAFYKEAAAAARRDDIKELFETLIVEEGKHRDYFLELMGMVKDEDGFNPVDPYPEESIPYLDALADSSVFAGIDADALAKQTGSEEEAIMQAIDMEKESILFYYELLEMVREKDKDLLKELIAEERGHIAILSEHKALLNK